MSFFGSVEMILAAIVILFSVSDGSILWKDRYQENLSRRNFAPAAYEQSIGFQCLPYGFDIDGFINTVNVAGYRAVTGSSSKMKTLIEVLRNTVQEILGRKCAYQCFSTHLKNQTIQKVQHR